MDISKQIEEHREECTKGFIKSTNFWTVIGITITILSIMFGYLTYDVRQAMAKADMASVENAKVQSQLSQIQTDIQWIKLELSKK